MVEDAKRPLSDAFNGALQGHHDLKAFQKDCTLLRNL